MKRGLDFKMTLNEIEYIRSKRDEMIKLARYMGYIVNTSNYYYFIKKNNNDKYPYLYGSVLHDKKIIIIPEIPIVHTLYTLSHEIGHIIDYNNKHGISKNKIKNEIFAWLYGLNICIKLKIPLKYFFGDMFICLKVI